LDRIIKPALDNMNKSAVISECKKYRYSLVREWASNRPCCFIGLNPSTADAGNDDQTIRRCIGFAREWGCGSLHMYNLFAYRATDPAAMFSARKKGVDIVGPRNDEFLESVMDSGALIIAAWGTHGSQSETGKGLIETGLVQHLGLNKNGSPKHPLYLRKDTKPQPFQITPKLALV